MTPCVKHWLRWLVRPFIAAAMIPVGVLIGAGGLAEHWFRRRR